MGQSQCEGRGAGSLLTAGRSVPLVRVIPRGGCEGVTGRGRESVKVKGYGGCHDSGRELRERRRKVRRLLERYRGESSEQ